jgi:lipopolysaccharide assembly outer membrane protein LptD (OstA)
MEKKSRSLHSLFLLTHYYRKLRISNYKIIPLFFLLLISNQIFSQDTTKLIKRDTTLSGKTDTSIVKSDIDTIVSYEGKDSIIYDIPNRTTTLYGSSKISFRNWKIEAEIIKIYWNTYKLIAKGIPDPKDSTKYVGLPNFWEGNENYKGFEVEYNFKNKSGVIKHGETAIDNGFYKGEKIKKEPENFYFIKDGSYTTCDKPHPHFYFYSPKMKVIPNNQIIAEPVVFYIAEVPVFAIPFAVLPNKGGRASGIIPPAYGDDLRRGKNLRHLGYYWAINDYSDLSLTTDQFMKGGYVLNSNFQYNLRYYFNGRIDLSYSRQKFDIDETPRKDWRLSISHNQTFNPTTQLMVNFNFISNSYFQNTSINYNEILQQNMISTATLNTSWEGTNRSISISMYRDQNLQNGNISENLPSLSFSQSQIYPFKSGKSSLEPKWYELVGLNYNAQLLNTHTKIRNDQTGDYSQNYRRGIKHDVSFNISPKLGNFNISPSISYSELWYDKSIKKENIKTKDGRDSIVTSDVIGFITTRQFYLGLSGSTRFFGIFKPNMFGVTGIRHTITPSISYNIRPDFSDPFFKSYGTYTDSLGREIKYNRFEREVFGGPPAGKSQSISLSVGNIFEMKTAPKDTASEENKIQLLNVNGSIGYNFAADSLRLSDLNVNYRTNIANIFDLSGSTSWNFYKYEQQNGLINKFLINDGSLARLTNINFNVSTSFKGEKSKKAKEKEKSKQENTQEEPQQKSQYFGLYDQETSLDIPWNLSISYDFNLNKYDPFHPSKSSSLRANLGFNLTDNWKFTFSGYYDLVNRQLLAPMITVYRDLHCWEMNLSWVPTGPYARFYFEIKIKASQLQDIKILKQGSVTGVF